ncbi:acyl carrier protein [Nodularia harveyana UHCC-0300]|uniref:Acyl carrier protein n=1 Tax=Nodularia harveyana UHCC-0300 TaxID=2974287 RepID=A0A9E7VDD7_9CYAN|nr:acyl carrier protein [Nodularia harveyana]MEA5581856.1 acyl carrier protein [Nodularia harveyana UHCC-0300]UZC80152.1 PuwD [Nodularia harveyana UHCC-0300]
MTTTNSKNIRSTEEIQDWLISEMADILEITPDEIDIKMLFDEYGLDSSMIIGMMGELEVWLGCNLDPTLVYDYSTIGDLAEHIGSILSVDS